MNAHAWHISRLANTDERLLVLANRFDSEPALDVYKYGRGPSPPNLFLNIQILSVFQFPSFLSYYPNIIVAAQFLRFLACYPNIIFVFYFPLALIKIYL